MSKRALICGVTGQDGAYLAAFLLSHGYEVWGTSRDATTSSRSNLIRLNVVNRVKLISMAPNDFRSALTAIDGSDPAEIYYLAGQTSVGLSFEQPAETLESVMVGILNILEIMRIRKRPCRLYNAGSSECFGQASGPVDENSNFSPRSPYAVAKASAHWLVSNYREAYGLFASTGILFNHESPLRPVRFVTQKIIVGAAEIAAGRQDRLRLGRLDVRRDWGWAPEYVEAMWRMLQQEIAEDFVIATGVSFELRDFAREAFAFHGLDFQRYVDESEAFYRPTDIKENVGNPSKAYDKLNWRATRRMPDVVREMSLSLQGGRKLDVGEHG